MHDDRLALLLLLDGVVHGEQVQLLLQPAARRVEVGRVVVADLAVDEVRAPRALLEKGAARALERGELFHHVLHQRVARAHAHAAVALVVAAQELEVEDVCVLDHKCHAA